MSPHSQSAWVRDVQMVQLEILFEFDRICDKYKLKYQLFSGTLLGAIRHKGFIPWDDDIDVCMLRADYEKFLTFCSTDLDDKYFLQTFRTEPIYNNMYAKLRKNNTRYVENATSNCKIHQGIFIDVFPFDNVRPGKFIGMFQQKLLYILGSINQKRIKNKCLNASTFPKSFASLIIHYSLKLIPKRWLDSVMLRLACMFENDETRYVSCVANGEPYVWYTRYMAERKGFNNTVKFEFEGHHFPVPVNYDEVLTKVYGDYMKLPPEKERMSHHGITEVSL